MKRPVYYAIGMLLVVVGAFLSAFQAEALLEYQHMRDWPTVDGIVVEADIAGQRAIHPRVVYRYQVDSVIYESESNLHAPMFGGKRKKYDVAREMASHYSVGSPVTVYFNPDSAAQSAIVIGVTWRVYGQLALGVTLFFVGIVGFTPPVRRLFFGG